MSTQVILLERVEKLGNMGDVVNVKPGYARNYLLPQKKALRASKDNVAYFEAQKKQLEADNEKAKKEAEKQAKKIEGNVVSLIRQASEAGQLFGSVSARDIAEGLSEESGEKIDRTMIKLNQNYKLIGLFPVDVILHPEVKAEVTINIARSDEEAKIQAKTGKALIAEDDQPEEAAPTPEDAKAAAEEALGEVLEEGALEAEKERQAEAEEKAAEDAAKAEEKAAKKAEKDAAKAAAEDAEAEAENAEAASEEPAEENAEEDKAEA
ncbi:MAG: 50S ribosomal protein L9 [Pseudomonadota bacterium]